MGASTSERAQRGRQGSEVPQRRCKITHDFYLGKYECTVGEFRAFVEETGYKTDQELHPYAATQLGSMRVDWEASVHR